MLRIEIIESLAACAAGVFSLEEGLRRTLAFYREEREHYW
jgi:ASC-1-like (ASCH) protein